ncbi:UNVERIFIED_CONTAM: hypothetical protein RMT77_005029 [Armadillidium vulgare]
MNDRSFSQILALPLVTVILTLLAQQSGASNPKTRIVYTKYGQVQGFIRHLGDLLGDVEVFKGVPYASPPIEEGRFTPTNTPTPWEGVFDATVSPPVCPQLLPDLDKAGETMPKERVIFIRSLQKNLKNQSEDCLTLSIYTPIMVIPGSEVYPVLVFFHGESFSWGAGTLYDGSVLAAYGRVVVVTINYRLGPLGFLNTYGGGSGVVSNFALLDQISALNWIGENIEQFGGDPSRVTLFGRDAGAACISHLTQSPIVPPGLFQRAVLLSGGAWCPWAQVASPLSMTIRLALTLDCPVPEDPGSPNPHTVECLRRASLSDIMRAAKNITPPAFTPAWGPSEDGVVVARGRHSQSQGRPRMDWIIGVTPHESWSWLGEDIISKGVDSNLFERVVRSFVRNTRKHHLREVMAVAVQEYTDWTNENPTVFKRRDHLLDLLSDAGTVAPLLQGMDTLLESGKVFFFVCDLSSAIKGKIQHPGWELALLFGAGLTDVISSPGAPTPPLEGPALAQLSEDFITLLTNFAKSGDPNLPRESPSPGFAAVAWPKYTKDARKFLQIGVPPSIGSHYRAHQLALWNWLVPELEAAGAHSPAEADSWEISSDSSLFYGEVRPPDPWHFLQPTTPSSTTTTTTELIAAAPAVVATSSNFLTPRVTTTLALSPTMGSKQLSPSESTEYVKYSTALLVTVGLGVSLLMLNGLVFLLLFWRRSGSHRCDGSHHSMENVMSVPRVGSMMSMSGTLGGGGGSILGPPIGGSFGGPPDCIKTSYDKLHLTAEELQRLSRSPTGTSKRSQSPPEPLAIPPQTFHQIPNVIPIKRSRDSRETSFTLDATFRNLEVSSKTSNGGSRNVESDDECRVRTLPKASNLRRPSTPGILCRSLYDHPERMNGMGFEVEHAPSEISERSDTDRSIIGECQASVNSTPPCGTPSMTSSQDIKMDDPHTGNRTMDRRPNGWPKFLGTVQEGQMVPDPPPPPRSSTLRREKKVTIVEEAVHRL